MEASFLFALSALKEWRIDDFDVKQSNIQRHTNPSMVLFCVCFSLYAQISIFKNLQADYKGLFSVTW